MSRKQRVLTGLREIEGGLLKAAKKGSKKTVANLMQNLAVTRDICREGLPTNSYAKYGEIYDGLILAVEQMTKVKELRSNEEAFSLSNELLQYIIRETEQETNFKKDIFFLPYKASMWDSLESIWKAAYEDNENCNAYVVPIPYADLNPDRSVARWHCERDLFPKYVPTLDYKTFDLEALHPDVIFIHNPYDDFNLVTSVDPRFYSSELKKCTDKLVYIPYFVLEEPCTEETVEHFVTTPGVMNADKIIVQSEAMHELYVNILVKKTNQTNRTYWEERISGAGSPKIDKVLTSKKEDFDMSEEWLKLIEGRKVILYNTSLSAMLQHTERVCDKLRYIFDVFRNRDDVVLWWRPHPLMKSTFHSMRPQFEAEYLSLEKEYIEEGWGIYDESSDLHRAICYSDAYYGDMSSVVALYQLKNRPILLEDFLNLPYKPYWMFDVVSDDNNKLYFNSPAINGICSVEWATGKLKIEHIFNGKDFFSEEIWSYALIQKVDDLLILSPFMSPYICTYDTNTLKETFIPMNKDFVKDGIKFYVCVKRNDSLFFIGRVPVVMEYSVKTNEIAYHLIKNKNFEDLLTSSFVGYSPCAESENDLWMALGNSNCLIRFNYENKEMTCYEVGDKNDEYQYVAVDGNYLYMTTRSATLVQWDIENNITHKYHFETEKSTEPFLYFTGVIYTGLKVLLFPNFFNDYAKSVVIFDYKNKKAEYVDIRAMGYRGYNWVKQFSNGDILAYEPGAGQFHKYDNYGKLIEVCAVDISAEDKDRWNMGLLHKKGFLYEQGMIDIAPFVDSIVREEYDGELPAEENNTYNVCGKKIYGEIINEVF